MPLKHPSWKSPLLETPPLEGIARWAAVGTALSPRQSTGRGFGGGNLCWRETNSSPVDAQFGHYSAGMTTGRVPRYPLATGWRRHIGPVKNKNADMSVWKRMTSQSCANRLRRDESVDPRAG